MKVFWVDQAEYYFVCDECYELERDGLWTGSTTVPNWDEHKKLVYKELKTKTRCEFCGQEEEKDSRG